MKNDLCMVSVLLIATALAVQLATPASTPENAVEVTSATWQDPNTVVVLWEADAGETYQVLRSDSIKGEYVLQGESSVGAFIDSEVVYPNVYYYKLQVSDAAATYTSAPAKSGYAPRKLSGVYVFMYHHVIPEAQFSSGELSDDFLEYAISQDEFAADLQFLNDNGYTAITSNELVAYMSGEAALPDKAVIISIDDGSLSVYQYAYPLLKKYGIKAELNVIGKQIDDTTDPFIEDRDRVDDRTPEDYCHWWEIREMSLSGIVSIASHSYALHRYDPNGRTGAQIKADESIQDYTAVIAKDYELSYSCIYGWLDKAPVAFAYPYSKRDSVSDATLLSNTGYKILMSGSGARITNGNYFVDGAPYDGYQPLMNRIPRMRGTTLSQYLTEALSSDGGNGVNGNTDSRD